MRDPQKELKTELYFLSPASRLSLTIAIFLALFLANEYSNLIYGAIAGYLLYPLVEYFIRVTSE
jgi:hypothetical protein